MTIDQAVVLGIVQGITEFLPISSSGHLILIPEIFNWELQSLTFDLGLHAGTAFAVLLFFYKDWQSMAISFLKDLPKTLDFVVGKISNLNTLRPQSKLLTYIFIATIPVGIIGILLEETAENFFRSPLLVAVMMIVVSGYMAYAEFFSKKKIPQVTPNQLPSQSTVSENTLGANFSFRNILIISLSQIIALIPGSSRSGMTISTGLLFGYKHEEAARISFLLATPIILGAAVIKIPDMLSLNSNDLNVFLIGMLTSFLVGLGAIKFLLNFLKNHGLMPFIIYRLVLAFSLLVIWITHS